MTEKMRLVDRVTPPSEEAIPVDINGWEHILVRHFLTVGREGDASDIHAIEVSPRTLALACGSDPGREGEIEEAFRDALLRDQVCLLRALREGPQRRPSTDVPNCFAMLAMTLLIDLLLEGTADTGNQFRAKLADWLRIDRTFSDLSGVKLMWEELAQWLEMRVMHGAPFRRLVLPDPRSWHHIGYTRRLSFPNRADVRAVAQVLATVPERDLDNPVTVIQAAAQLEGRRSISVGLKDAYDDFVQSYYSQRRAIADHRFWRLVAQARTVGTKPRLLAALDIGLTADEEHEFRVMRVPTDEVHVHWALSAALRDKILTASTNLGSAVGRGLLFFRQVGLGRWTAEPDLAKCRDRVLVAFDDRFTNLIRERLGTATRDGQWKLTVDPVDAIKVATELRMCGVMVDGSVQLFRPMASDGVRVHGAWLGLPGFLPSIDADTDKLRVIPERNDVAEVRITMAGNIRLVSDTPVAGAYLVEPHLLQRESRPPWRLRLQFVDRAAPHLKLGGARQNLSLLEDWSTMGPARVASNLPCNVGWARSQNSMEWLLEALYASGANGWDESDLVDLVRRADPETNLAPWRTLRMLQEGGVIESRLRHGWKGRVWTLVPPRIVVSWTDNTPIALAEGALCLHTLEAFELAIIGMGGMPFRIPGAARWSVPVTGAVGVDPGTLASRLGWALVELAEAPSSAPLALVKTDRIAENYKIAFTWCWLERRFKAFGATEGGVRLAQLSHPAASDHDVYRVECDGKRWHFFSRQAAIVCAHSIARVPLFAFVDDRIEVMARDGGLPDKLATALRRRRLASSGFTDDSYEYPAAVEDAAWLAALLPGCVVGTPTLTEPSTGEVLSRSRRSRGALRVQWREGRLTL